ncbi:MAG: CBS domain-containing protein [Candidatus Latescibacteria bacterium]|nr:CBS domain-containing protein [Candidatus Latescibacterota bacterium]
MPFWHYHADTMTDDDSIQPLDPIRRNVYVGAKVATPKRLLRQAESGDFEASEAISAYKEQVKHPSKPKLAVRAEQIMSASVVSIDPDTSLNDVRKLVRSRRFRHVPVVTSEGFILGVVSDRDLFALPNDGDDTSETIELRLVADIMSKSVLTATPDTNIREIARVLFEERIGCMPIVDEEGLVVGIITRSDILRALIKHAPLDLWI